MGSMRTLLIAAVCAIALSTCATPRSGTSNSWCESHDLDDYRRTADERALETPNERRVRLSDLQYGAANCGWKP